MVFIKTYSPPPFDEKEILRYAGCAGNASDLRALLDACMREAERVLSYKVCYLPTQVCINGDTCDFGAFRVVSKDLAGNLEGCENVVLFAATVGVGIDRLTAKYNAVSPAKALMLDAMGTERAEALCDAFCHDISKETGKYPGMRFSPGYGDLDISFQKVMFSALDCRKNIGLTLTDSFMMSPAKSVTAIMGLHNVKRDYSVDKCAVCDNKECVYRGSL